MDGNFKMANYDLSESIATLQADVKPILKQIPVCHHFCPLRDQASEPSSTPTVAIDTRRAALTMTLDPGPSAMKLDRVARTVGKMVMGGHPLHFVYGWLEGERSERNESVPFHIILRDFWSMWR